MNLTSVCPDGKYSRPGSDGVEDCNCPEHAVSRQNAQRVSECICDAGYYKVYKPSSPLGGWYCEVCVPGQFCYNNTNRTCPPHSTSLSDAADVLDCYCGAGFANATVQTETELCVDCPANFYCTGKGAVTRCVTNAVSSSQSQDYTKCYCDWGWKGVNNSVCVACDTPSYCYGGIQAQCPGGSFSKPLSWNPSNCSCIPGYWGPVGGPCIMCGTGKYNNISGCKACSSSLDTDCMLCPVGTYSTMLGRNSSSCDTCKPGSYSYPSMLAGASTCWTCQNGTYSLAGAGECTKCSLGWYAPVNSSACTACPVNTYLNVEGKGGVDACMPCPLGTVSSRLGNSDPGCSACSPGSYQLNGVCTSCAAGKFSKTASVVCTPCPNGTYSLENATSCTSCDAGKYSRNESSGACQLCPVGTYAPAPGGASVCLLCPYGSIAAGVGALNCSVCPYGTYAPNGSGVCTACPAGSWGLGSLGWAENCTSCVPGKYSTALGATDMSGTCKDCYAGSYSNTTRASQVRIDIHSWWALLTGLVGFVPVIRPGSMYFFDPFPSIMFPYSPFHIIGNTDNFKGCMRARRLFRSQCFHNIDEIGVIPWYI